MIKTKAQAFPWNHRSENSDYPKSVVEVLSSIFGDDIVKLPTEQSHLYHSQNAQKWTVLPNTKMVQYHICRNEKVFGTNNFDGTSQKGKYKRLLVH